jgi:PAS domain S-box-containing protein
MASGGWTTGPKMDRPPLHRGNGQTPISLAYLPPTERQTRSTLVGAVALLLVFAALTPFSAIRLRQFNGFIPALDATIFITEFLTAGILFAHFSATRSRALLVLACGYLFSALMVVVHGLTFPDAFSPTRDPIGSSHFNLSIYLFWHLGLPVTLFAYIRVRDKDRGEATANAPTLLVLIWSIVGVLFAVACAVSFAMAGALLFPPSPNNFNPFIYPAAPWLINITMLIGAVALFAMWAFRRSVLDQWLMIVLLASLVELEITGHLGWIHPFVQSPGLGSRFTLGFYTGRVLFSLVTSTLVLTVLLAETSRLYADVARANMLTDILKASQALSGEIELPSLIERLMTVVLRYTGADRALLILPHHNRYRIEAEARMEGDDAVLQFPHDPAMPETIIRQVIEGQAPVILDDAAKPNPFSEDPYLDLRRPRSILCLPLVRQGVLGGLFYLETRLTPQAFTPERARLLELLAAQASISLENAALYDDLKLQVGLLHNLPVSAWTLRPDGTPDFVNQVWLEFSGQTLDFVRSHPEAWMTAVHPEDRKIAAKTFWEGVHSGQGFAFETRSLRAQDEMYRWHLNQAVVLRDSEGKVLKFVGTTTDIDDQKRTEEALRQVQSDLARINRMTTMGELAASLAHEISQPISGAITNTHVCLRRLGQDKPNLDEVRAAVTRIARDAQRAAEIIERIRSQFQKGSPKREPLAVSEIIGETIALLRDQAVRYNISVRTELAPDLPLIVGDRVQLQQVAMNLIVNSIEAMKDVDGIREMIIKAQRSEDEHLLVSVSDTGMGFSPHLAEQIFDPFFTTKPNGTGMGLRISRSIVESHGGRMWAVGTPKRGATFRLILPAARKVPQSLPTSNAELQW